MTPRFQVDSAGRSRRLCDAPVKYEEAWRKREDGLCVHYAAKILEDGTGRCTTHDEGRKASWVMCSQPVAWNDAGRPSRTCGHRGRFVFEGRWYCRSHDPLRPRCENVTAHPWVGAVLGAVPVGRVQSPHTPRSEGAKLFGLRLCPACRKPGSVREPRQEPREVRPPCCLCHGTACLEDDAGRFFPCLCTPGGRQIANGGLNDAQVAACLAADCTVAFVHAQRAG